ncbi:putative fatty acyl synthetase 1 [Leptomonas seymouri]|uniref:Putative fatty acyl synthetase 1 n=1 Tax=Leptomonas seymouri TaxID=5684 RepID=A0A0N1I0L9_LEPSE|nr:putative fatty acyl synthetase 1 [Leptomonas seymouri]|eukprot:KPI82572.1 putative fatty acyl synthetase 1 [Leptomonas seymouri]
MPLEEVIRLPVFCSKAAASMAALGQAARRKPFELPRVVRFVLEEWTPENGTLTAAMKLKRRVISERFADQIDEMFLKE